MGLLRWFADYKKLERKIRGSFEKIKSNLASITSIQLNNSMKINKNSEGLQNISNEIKELRTELRTKVRTEPRTKVVYGEKILERAKKTRPELIKQAILQLIDKDMRTTQIEEFIVREKKLCGKTQFYHYLGLLRTELRAGLRTELKVKL